MDLKQTSKTVMQLHEQSKVQIRKAVCRGVKRKPAGQRWESNAVTGAFPQPTSTPMEELPTLSAPACRAHGHSSQSASQFPQKASDSNRWCDEKKKSYCLDKNRGEFFKSPSLVSIRFPNITNLLSIVQRGEWHRYCYKLFIYELWLPGYAFPPLKSKSEPHVHSVT